MTIPEPAGITAHQNKRLWALVSELARHMGSRDEATAIMRDVVKDKSGQESTKALSRYEADLVLMDLTERLGNNRQAWSRKRWGGLAKPRPGMATAAQIRMLEAMAVDALKGDTPDDRRNNLRRVLKRQAGIDDLRFLQADQVTQVKAALVALGRRNGREMPE